MEDAPFRFLGMTYNLWAGSRWPEREPALREFLKINAPDILCVQELRPQTMTVVDEVLPDHDRVREAFGGWQYEGNIWWRADMFELVQASAHDIGLIEPLRRLFCARLRAPGARRRTLLAATAHYTWPGHAVEASGGASPRFDQATKTVATLNRVVERGEPVLFMGDLNESNTALDVLRRDGGLVDSFAALGRSPVPTWPALPTAGRGAHRTIDWMLHRGPLRVLTSEVIDFYHGDLAPSDHKPVAAMYELT